MRKIIKNSKGQLSIFLAITVVFFITAVAFVINIGLFVKAKINLQNAVDAGAFSGAAVQARQLTDIAYLNWEMRNVYKEWMFKYYVLGNLNAPVVEDPTFTQSKPIPDGMMDFTIKDSTDPSDPIDLNNIPSVCIQLGGDSYCRIFKSPGIPRMSNEIISQQELANFGKDFIDELARTKAARCSDASKINFEVTRQWAYGMGSAADQTVSEIPNVGGDRPGAFPKALELAIRIRNLEAFVNKAPDVSNICEGSNANCSKQIQEIINQNDVANERTVKAFYAAWRNLGGEKNRELKDQFTFSELGVTPATVEGGEKSLSNTFIPASSPARQKYYLDLQLYSVNYVTFYTQMTPLNESNPDERADSGCQMTKVAIPVPAYPLGYIKNPKVMTYYGVRGQSRFNGLFNPLSKVLTLSAHSLAKPFGGRIGPRFFKTVGSYITATDESGNQHRSSPYVFGLVPQPSNTGSIDSILGVLPKLPDFWVQNKDEPIGGDFGAGLPKFAIPNMHYDLDPGDPDRYYDSNIHIMSLPIADRYRVGLYNKEQFKKFVGNLSATGGNINATAQITNDDVERAIAKVRLPTRYDAQNYLIPSTNKLNGQNGLKLNSFAFEKNRMQVFAPLYGPNYLYANANDVQAAVETYVVQQKPSIETFMQTLATTAQLLRNQADANETDVSLADEAASIISNEPLSCKSIAGQFAFYYLGRNEAPIDNSDCGDLKPFSELLREYIDNPNLIKPDYYEEADEKIDQMVVEDPSSEFIFSAYSPGSYRGYDSAGETQNPFSGRKMRDLRNFYSTKFISFDTYENYKARGLYNEGGGSQNSPGPLANPLIPDQGQPFSQIFR